MNRDQKKAVAAIESAGALLVFPMENRPEPASLWSVFHPRSEMRWEWDESGDDRVGRLWHLRSELSTTRAVVYTKWYRGRATYLSRALFAALLSALNGGDPAGARSGLGEDARRILETLEAESPLSTKELKRLADLRGSANEARFTRAMTELWSRLLVVAFGEVDDGAFPSLAVGATRSLYEDLWRAASALDPTEADRRVRATLAAPSSFLKHYLRLGATRPAATSGTEGGARAKRAPATVSFESLSRPTRGGRRRDHA